jgi:integrase
MGHKRIGAKAASASSIEISFTYRGIRCREKLKLKPTPANLKRAERHRSAIIEAIDNGTFEYQVTFPNSKNAIRFANYTGMNTTIKQYMNNWIDSKESEIKASTFASYERIVRNQILPEFGHLKLAELTRIDVKRWCKSMDCSLKRIKNITSVFRDALQDATYDSLIAVNPLYGWQFRRNDPPKARIDEIDPFSKAEMKEILAASTGQNKNLIQFWMETGLRTSELIALEWSDIDFIENKAHIWKAKTDAAVAVESPKTAAGNRFIELTETAMTAIQNQKEITFLEGNTIFQNPRSETGWTGDRQIRNVLWMPALKKAGVRYRYPYQVRHTFASTRLMAATSIGEIMYIAQMLGHRDWVFTAKTYSRFIKGDFFQHQQRNKIVS